MSIVKDKPVNIDLVFLMVHQDYTFERASLRHLDLFQYQEALLYKKVLHIRPEVLVMRSLDILFQKKIESGLIYSYCESDGYDHNTPWYGLMNYSQENLVYFKTNYIKTWTSSVYMMVPDEKAKYHFTKIRELADRYIGKRVYNDTCYMNFYYNMQKLSNTKLLKGLVESRNIKTNIEGKPTVSDTSIDIRVVMINFCGLAYSEEKRKRMNRYLRFLQEMQPCISKSLLTYKGRLD